MSLTLKSFSSVRGTFSSWILQCTLAKTSNVIFSALCCVVKAVICYVAINMKWTVIVAGIIALKKCDTVKDVLFLRCLRSCFVTVLTTSGEQIVCTEKQTPEHLTTLTA